MKYFEKFLNEAKKSEMIVGYYVFFTKNLRNAETKGKFGEIIEILTNEEDKKYIEYVVEFINYYNNKVKLILTKNQIAQLLVFSPKDYELINTGKLVLPKFSKKLNLVLAKLNFKIPDYKFIDVSYLDIDPERDNMITYLPAGKIEVVPKEEKYTSKLRQSMKVGGFFKKIYSEMDNVTLEKLGNLYRTAWTSVNGKHNQIEIIRGEEIRLWYLKDNYSGGSTRVGSLWRSCMRHQKSQKRFDIYCENPDKIALMIIVDEDLKLLARAILWRLSEPEGKIYLDRQYSVDVKYDLMMQERAKAEGWLYYGADQNKRMKVYLNKNYGDASKNPYMDTFKYFCIEKSMEVLPVDNEVKYYLTSYENRYQKARYVDHD